MKSPQEIDIIFDAITKGETTIVMDLINANNINTRKNHITPLMAAADANNVLLVNEMLKVPNRDLGLQDSNGNTALMRAIKNKVGDSLIGLIIFEMDATNVNIQNLNGDTALLLLLKRGNQINYELVNLLINKGADPSIKNKLGQSAHDLQNIKYSSTGALLAQEKIKDEYASQMQTFLSMAKLPASEFEYITDYSTLQQFRVAFTLKGVQSIKNYEEYEWIGDGIIHGILSQYIPIKYIEKKNLRATNEGYFGNLRTAYETNEYMEQVLKHYKLDRFIIKPHVNLNIDHKVYADVFEAIIGLFVELIDNRMGRGYGYMYAFNLLENIFDDFPPKIITFINTLPQGTMPKEQISMGKEMVTKSVSESRLLYSPKKAPVFSRLSKVITTPVQPTPVLTPSSSSVSRSRKRYTPRISGAK